MRAGDADEVFAVDTRPLDDIHNDPVKPRTRDSESSGSETRGTVVITPSDER